MNIKPIIYDLFCDASVGPNLKGTCAGCLVIRRPCTLDKVKDFPDHMFHYCIIPGGTNNAGESTAVAMATSIAIDLYNFMSVYNCFIVFNIFSDSLITINAVRDWMPGWIKNMDKNGNLRNSTGIVAANQEKFKFIYNTILANASGQFHINYIHQKGHIVTNTDRMLEVFARTNPGIDFRCIGLSTFQMCRCNDFVDNETRCIINQYLNTPKSHLPIEWSDRVLTMKNAIYNADTIIDNSPAAVQTYKNRMKFYLPM